VPVRALQTARHCLLLASLIVVSVGARADDSGFVGKWRLTLKEGRMTKEALLEIRDTGDGLAAWVEGGTAPLVVDGDRIEIAIDDRKIRGGSMVRYLRGTHDGESLSGEYGPDHDPTEQELAICENIPLACTVPTGTWQAVPEPPPGDAAMEPAPVDLSGAWEMIGRPLYKYTSDLTDAGQAWKDGFDVTMDLPGLRCQPWGLVNSWGFRAIGTPEIFQGEKQITMVTGTEVRRIYLDGRRPPEYTDWYPNGFSNGHWEGSTLVVTTDHLQPSIREWMGDPVSEDAVVVERYHIDEDGFLVGVMALHDPVNYNEPPLKRARWRRASDDAIRFPSLCDPDSFYRELYDDGRLDTYWQRSDRRF
jgi:hypothetical protein